MSAWRRSSAWVAAQWCWSTPAPVRLPPPRAFSNTPTPAPCTPGLSSGPCTRWWACCRPASPPGSGDPAYDEADRRLRELSSSAAAPFEYAGAAPVEAIWAGACPVDVVLTAGFGGALLLDAVTRVMGASQADAGAGATQSGLMSASATAPEAPVARSTVALGVDGVVVSSTAATGSAVAGVIAGITRAADAVTLGLVPALTQEMARLLARRRASAAAVPVLQTGPGR